MSDFASFGDGSLPTGGDSGGGNFGGGGFNDPLSGLGMGDGSGMPWFGGQGFGGGSTIPGATPAQTAGVDPATQAAAQAGQDAPRPPQPSTPSWVNDALKSLIGGQQNAASPTMQAMAERTAQQGTGWGPGLKGLMNQASASDLGGMAPDPINAPSGTTTAPVAPNIVSGPAPPTGQPQTTGYMAQVPSTAGLTGGLTTDPTTGGGQAPTALPPITVKPDQPDTATSGTPPDAKTVKTAPVTGGPTGAIPGDVTQATPSAATTPPATTATNPPQSVPGPGNNYGPGGYGGQYGPGGPPGGILGMIMQAIGGLLGIDVSSLLGQLGMPDGQNMAGMPPPGAPMAPPEWGPAPQGPWDPRWGHQPPYSTSPGQPTPGGTPGPLVNQAPGAVTPGARDPSMQRGDPFTTRVAPGGGLSPQVTGPDAAFSGPPTGPTGTPVQTTHPTQQVGGAAGQQGGDTGAQAWPGGPPDYFQKHGGIPGRVVPVNTAFGPVNANPMVARDIQGLTNEMKAAGVPGINSLGSLGPGESRRKAYGHGLSSHSYGAAFDINNQAGQMNPQTQQWIRQNPQKWNDMLRRWHFSQYMPSIDPNHLEWTGPGTGNYAATGGGIIPGAMATGPGGGPAGNRMTAGASGAPPTGGRAMYATSQNPQERATATHAGLAQARQALAPQLQDPNTMRLLAASTLAEVGGQGPLAEQAYIETVLNRSASRNIPLNRNLTGAAGQGGYYPATTLNKLRRTPSAADMQRIQGITQRVMAGSNVSNFGTGNGAGGFNKGRLTYSAGGRGERFGTEGPDLAWAQRMQGGSQEAQRFLPSGTDAPGGPLADRNMPAQIGNQFPGTNWPKFEAEARPSTNIEDERIRTGGLRTIGDLIHSPAPQTGTPAMQGPTGMRGDYPGRSAISQAPWPGQGQDPASAGPQGGPLAGRPEPGPQPGPQPYNRNVDDLGRPIPDVTATPPAPATAQAGQDVPLPRSDPRKGVPLPRPDPRKAPGGKRQRPQGMTKSQRRSIQNRQARRQTQAPPPTPMLSPYGGGSATGPNVQPGQPGYEQAMRYYYGR